MRYDNGVMDEKTQIRYLKISIVIGLLLLLVGHYILSYSDLPTRLGINGLILGGACMAAGLIFSLPTKMYLTFLLVTKENRSNAAQSEAKQSNVNK
ncbi:hypothetical protein QWY77_03145 [Thalassotalea ponticola]|uniref:hypothetical protein n=1 Tax=Thalassotalea ponticola TaxID=1523392 RepID=UPI0025B3EB36|nr:hypothetical protein [Thalassotalea ponticola]MDN3651761.1 hypothetical protein [Thalassotalea ponticola]